MSPSNSCRLCGVALLATASLFSGCAVGGVGTLAAHVSPRDAVTVMTVHSIGLHVRTWRDDAGAHLGYSRRVYTLPAGEDLLPGWHFLKIAEPVRASLALDLTTYGFELSLEQPEAGLALGYSRKRLFAKVPMHADVFMEFSGPELQITRLKLCEGDASCALR